jgi:hypothetical protein
MRLATVQEAAVGDCLSFDPFPFDQNGLAPPEVDVSGRQVGDAFVISQEIVVGDPSFSNVMFYPGEHVSLRPVRKLAFVAPY